jgi:hypothetical protein
VVDRVFGPDAGGMGRMQHCPRMVPEPQLGYSFSTLPLVPSQ